MPRARTVPQDAITSWAQARSLPRWLLPLAALMSALLIVGALTVLLRVEHLTVRAVPDADAGAETPTHALPSEVRILQASWAIVRMVDEWRSAGLESRFAEAAPFIAPRIRADIKEHFQSLLARGVVDVRPAKAIVALGSRILGRDQGVVTVALAYDAVDLVESDQGRMSVAHDEVAVMVLTLAADAVTDENPYGLLAQVIERNRGEDYQDRFWAGEAGHRVVP
jgi:hypothetical protein